MKHLSLLLLLFLPTLCFPQTTFNWEVEVSPVEFEGLPALQSFVFGIHNGDWIVLGGRTDGLHKRQPWATFQPDGKNRNIYLINPETKEVKTRSLTGFPTDLLEQLESTNMQFKQVGDALVINGGYGYSPTQDEHITYPSLLVLDLPGLHSAMIMEEADLSKYFYQITDSRMQVTGGYLEFMNGYFYLIGGQNFLGRYNPMGPDHGPGFVQEYTNEIRKFRISEVGDELEIADYTVWQDSAELHRRDYNLVPQIFPNGQNGFTVFSGVFHYEIDLPWLNTVDVFESGYQPNESFMQYLNQYHTAHTALYDSENNQMHTIFWGGISRYYYDENGILQDDLDVPFVNTISLVTRDSNGKMVESKIGEMPALLGSAAQFIPAKGMPEYWNEIIDLNQLNNSEINLGYILGGIESSAPNIFWLNEEGLSSASNTLYSVKLKQRAVETEIIELPPSNLKIYPNPIVDGKFTIEINLEKPCNFNLDIMNPKGRQMQTISEKKRFDAGIHKLEVDLSGSSAGMYFVRMYNDGCIQQHRVILD